MIVSLPICFQELTVKAASLEIGRLEKNHYLMDPNYSHAFMVAVRERGEAHLLWRTFPTTRNTIGVTQSFQKWMSKTQITSEIIGVR